VGPTKLPVQGTPRFVPADGVALTTHLTLVSRLRGIEVCHSPVCVHGVNREKLYYWPSLLARSLLKYKTICQIVTGSHLNIGSYMTYAHGKAFGNNRRIRVFLPANNTAIWTTKSKPLAAIHILFLNTSFINFHREVLLKFPENIDLACSLFKYSVWVFVE
jgi:hypothetical protein